MRHDGDEDDPRAASPPGAEAVEEEAVFFLDEEEAAAAEAPPAEAEPLPEGAFGEVRDRAWEAFARGLEGRDGRARRRRAPRRPYGRLRVLGELAVAVGGLALLNRLAFPLDPGFLRADFNPFFLPAIFLGLRYGTLPGLAAGAAGALWVSGILDGPVEPSGWALPGLLVAVGAFAGLLSRGQAGRLAFYRARTRLLEGAQASFEAALRAKDAVVRDLQDRIEECGVSVQRLYRLSRGMGSSDPREMMACLLEILAKDLKASRVSVYRVCGDRLRLQASYDPRLAGRPFEEELPAGEGLAGVCLQKGRTVSCCEAGGASDVLCGLVRAAGGDLVVRVEEMPLLDFGPAVEGRFQVLLQWAEESLRRAAGEAAPRGLDLFDRTVGAYRAEFLAELLEREIARAHRYGTPLRVLMVRIDGYEALPERSRRAVRADLAEILFAHVRETDAVCLTEREDTLSVVMPMCDLESEELLAARIEAVFERFWGASRARLAASLGRVNGHPAGARALLLETQQGLER